MCLSVGASGQGLASFWNSKEKSEHVFFVGTDQQTYEMYLRPGQKAAATKTLKDRYGLDQPTIDSLAQISKIQTMLPIQLGAL